MFAEAARSSWGVVQALIAEPSLTTASMAAVGAVVIVGAGVAAARHWKLGVFGWRN